MRLLEAEIRKLNRPLTWCLLVFATAFVLLLASGAARNANLDMQNATGRAASSCAELEQAAGQPLTATQCAQAQAAELDRAHLEAARSRTAATDVTQALSPAAAGAEAAGLIASMPGALVIALLSGGHFGGEWSGRTLKSLLAQHGRRREVLAAKFASLWLAMVALVAACWAALAVAGPVLAKANGLPASQQSVRAGFEHSGSHIARALLVIAFFVLIGLLAGVLTQGTVGTISAAAGATVAILALGTVPSLGKYTPATFVEGWMGFSSVSRSAGALPDNFWSRFTDSHGVVPGHVFGLVGLVATMAVGAWIAWRRFGRMDVA